MVATFDQNHLYNFCCYCWLLESLYSWSLIDPLVFTRVTTVAVTKFQVPVAVTSRKNKPSHVRTKVKNLTYQYHVITTNPLQPFASIMSHNNYRGHNYNRNACSACATIRQMCLTDKDIISHTFKLANINLLQLSIEHYENFTYFKGYILSSTGLISLQSKLARRQCNKYPYKLNEIQTMTA